MKGFLNAIKAKKPSGEAPLQQQPQPSTSSSNLTPPMSMLVPPVGVAAVQDNGSAIAASSSSPAAGAPSSSSPLPPPSPLSAPVSLLPSVPLLGLSASSDAAGARAAAERKQTKAFVDNWCALCGALFDHSRFVQDECQHLSAVLESGSGRELERELPSALQHLQKLTAELPLMQRPSEDRLRLAASQVSSTAEFCSALLVRLHEKSAAHQQRVTDSEQRLATLRRTLNEELREEWTAQQRQHERDIDALLVHFGQPPVHRHKASALNDNGAVGALASQPRMDGDEDTAADLEDLDDADSDGAEHTIPSGPPPSAETTRPTSSAVG